MFIFGRNFVVFKKCLAKKIPYRFLSWTQMPVAFLTMLRAVIAEWLVCLKNDSIDVEAFSE